MELIRDDVKVEWVKLGEGFSGDYDPGDPTDVELLRFDVSKKGRGEWVEVPDASYCTLFPANTKNSIKMAGLRYIMDEVFEPVTNGYSIKKLCEKLSWIDVKQVKSSKERG